MTVSLCLLAHKRTRAHGEVWADPDGSEHVSDGTRNGLTLVGRSLNEVFVRHGMVAIDPAGVPFDPREHEALLTQPSSEVPEGTVLQVVQRGWRLGERVLRPARVVVSSTQAQAEGEI